MIASNYRILVDLVVAPVMLLLLPAVRSRVRPANDSNARQSCSSGKCRASRAMTFIYITKKLDNKTTMKNLTFSFHTDQASSLTLCAGGWYSTRRALVQITTVDPCILR
jgi:hypothetical protein